eukprot:CAMPEP_0171137856 /NCGR_PEP_ID=MMETSP0766_2-20121228/134078_1 /TAXON_ID=439317 /ORGANISM="Gambierdiscus australes, Strain CAWD 149" /LENGTH=57 /DNA_ID=CAMNT_0011601447 /DNA_START=30 /DNA_END=200 /DNA_ORIENTATION=-
MPLAQRATLGCQGPLLLFHSLAVAAKLAQRRCQVLRHLCGVGMLFAKDTAQALQRGP